MAATMATTMADYTEQAPMMHNRASMEMPKDMATASTPSHTLGVDDPANPMNWPLHRKLYTSAVSWAMAFAV